MNIRIARSSDASDIAAIYAPIVRDTVISFEADPPSSEDMAARISAIIQTHPWLVAEDQGRVTAYAYGSPHRGRTAYQWSSDVSVYVGEHARRTGTGRALYAQLFEILKQQGMATLYAGVTLPNEASVGFHENLGFEPVGIYRNVGFKSGAWRDVGWWSLALQSLGNAPTPPVSFKTLRDQLPRDLRASR